MQNTALKTQALSFYQFLREQGFNQLDADALRARYNSYRECDTDKPIIKQYAQYLRDFESEIAGVQLLDRDEVVQMYEQLSECDQQRLLGCIALALAEDKNFQQYSFIGMYRHLHPMDKAKATELIKKLLPTKPKRKVISFQKTIYGGTGMKKCNTADDPLCRDDLTIRKTEGTQWQAEMLQ